MSFACHAMTGPTCCPGVNCRGRGHYGYGQKGVGSPSGSSLFLSHFLCIKCTYLGSCDVQVVVPGAEGPLWVWLQEAGLAADQVIQCLIAYDVSFICSVAKV